MEKSAIFDPTGRYRYLLTRIWDADKPSVLFVMLNPSTANAEEDDPTIRRCIRFARDWGYGGVKVVNLFALVSSDPRRLVAEPDAIGGELDSLNDVAIFEEANKAGIVIAAWGSFKEARGRAAKVLNWMERLNIEIHCLGLTKDRCPKHPLYIRSDTKPILMKGGDNNG
jgi:hypothetical protein